MMGQIHVTPGAIPDVLLIEPTVHRDARGFFVEYYNERDLAEAGVTARFVQDNVSRSVRGVLRGLHFQKEFPQAKLVRASRGVVFDVAVDLRPGSPTFGKWHGETLSEYNHKMLYIPEGFAHGFLALSDEVEFCYKVTDFYHPGDEGGIAWDDPEIGVEWPGVEGGRLGALPLILSEKDRKNPSLAEYIASRGE